MKFFNHVSSRALDNGDNEFIDLDEGDPDMIQAQHDAVQSLEYFDKLLDEMGEDNVDASLLIREQDSEVGNVEMWIACIKRKKMVWLGTSYVGYSDEYITNIPEKGLRTIGPRRLVYIASKDVCDWMINKDGEVWGGYTIRVYRDKQPKKLRSIFDELHGIKLYKPAIGAS